MIGSIKQMLEGMKKGVYDNSAGCFLRRFCATSLLLLFPKKGSGNHRPVCEEAWDQGTYEPPANGTAYEGLDLPVSE